MLELSMSLSMKVNLGNYESADAFVCLSGIRDDTTQEQIDELLEVPGKIAYESLKKQLAEKVAALRQKTNP